jgi:elongation of very long chain fatty acids protein 4
MSSPIDVPLIIEVPIALALAGAHAYFLYTGYNAILSSNASEEVTASWVPLALPFSYIFTIWVGRLVMKSQQPLSLKFSMAVYNAYSTVLSAVMCYGFLKVLAPGGLSLWTSPFPTSPSHARASAAVFWIAMHSKYLEFADTFFFVLRKKDKQIS